MKQQQTRENIFEEATTKKKQLAKIRKHGPFLGLWVSSFFLFCRTSSLTMLSRPRPGRWPSKKYSKTFLGFVSRRCGTWSRNAASYVLPYLHLCKSHFNRDFSAYLPFQFASAAGGCDTSSKCTAPRVLSYLRMTALLQRYLFVTIASFPGCV